MRRRAERLGGSRRAHPMDGASLPTRPHLRQHHRRLRAQHMRRSHRLAAAALATTAALAATSLATAAAALATTTSTSPTKARAPPDARPGR